MFCKNWGAEIADQTVLILCGSFKDKCGLLLTD